MTKDFVSKGGSRSIGGYFIYLFTIIFCIFFAFTGLMARLLFLIVFPIVIWIMRKCFAKHLRNFLKPLKIASLLTVMILINIFFSFSRYQAELTSHITAGSISSKIIKSRNSPYHTFTEATVYYFSAKDPAKQWVFNTAGYGILILMFTSVFFTYFGLKMGKDYRIYEMRRQ